MRTTLWLVSVDNKIVIFQKPLVYDNMRATLWLVSIDNKIVISNTLYFSKVSRVWYNYYNKQEIGKL